MHLGFIGFGAMGRPMAEHLLRAGHRLFVWARRAESAAPLVAQGAVLCDSPAALAGHVEIVCTNVMGSADVDGLAFGDAGLAEGLAPGSLHVDFSTIAPGAARRIAVRYAERGVDFVDAPVSGGNVGAKNATLAIMWGGRAALAPRLQPLFAAVGKAVVHVGGPGAGQVAKACNQMIMVAAIEATAEAALLADAAGIDFGKVRQAMLGGSAGSRVLEVFGERMLQRAFSPGVEARLHHKDYALLLDEAARIGVPLPVASAVAQQLNALVTQGRGTADTSSLLHVLEESAGRSRAP
jgi:2-hydroxy-3-oxopropionate reductase